MPVLDEGAPGGAPGRARAAAHGARVDPLVGDPLARRQAGLKHPVHDFLFTYYSYRPAQLRRWHPGFAVDAPGHDGVTVDAAYVADRRPLVEATLRLLSATAARPAHLSCFG